MVFCSMRLTILDTWEKNEDNRCIDSYEVNPIDYRGYQDNKAGFVQSLLSNNPLYLMHKK